MAEAKKVKARVLQDCAFGKCNTVVTVEAADVEANPSLLDGNAAAVAYGETTAEHLAMLEAAKAAKK